MITNQTLKDFLHKQPFKPFTIFLADGRNYTVHHEDYVAVEPEGRRFAMFDEKGRLAVVNMTMITSIEEVV